MARRLGYAGGRIKGPLIGSEPPSSAFAVGDREQKRERRFVGDERADAGRRTGRSGVFARPSVDPSSRQFLDRSRVS